MLNFHKKQINKFSLGKISITIDIPNLFFQSS